MGRAAELPAVSEPLVEGLRELVDTYAAAHGVDVWCWQRAGEGWSICAATSSPPGAAPGVAAEMVTDPHVGEVAIETSSATAAQARFLALVIGRLLKHQAETRFFGREIGERYEEITLLYTISEILGSVISLEEAATTILAEVIDTMSVGRAALWVHNPQTNMLELVAAVGGGGQAGPVMVDDESSITAAVFRDRRPTILEPDDVFPRADQIPGTSNRESFLSVPLSFTPPRGTPRTIGVINLIGRTVTERFSAGDQKLITAIASQIAAAVENSRLVAESVRQERTDREMELAHDLQLKLLPSTDQFQDYAEVAARCSPAESVGGDFYHLFRLTGGRLGVVIGDVSSHGFSAALIMALTMSAVAIHASEGDRPSEVLRRVHTALIDELETTEMYLTLFYGVIDPASEEFCYANAGHAHAFRIRENGGPERLAATNLPFGFEDLDRYGETSVRWEPGRDLLLLFTDGLSDSISPARGEKMLVDRAAAERDRPLANILSSLFSMTRRTRQVPADDRTALLVRI